MFFLFSISYIYIYGMSSQPHGRVVNHFSRWAHCNYQPVYPVVDHHVGGRPLSQMPHVWNIYLPSGYVKIAIENETFIVDLPIENGDFP